MKKIIRTIIYVVSILLFILPIVLVSIIEHTKILMKTYMLFIPLTFISLTVVLYSIKNENEDRLKTDFIFLPLGLTTYFIITTLLFYSGGLTFSKILIPYSLMLVVSILIIYFVVNNLTKKNKLTLLFILQILVSLFFITYFNFFITIYFHVL